MPHGTRQQVDPVNYYISRSNISQRFLKRIKFYALIRFLYIGRLFFKNLTLTPLAALLGRRCSHLRTEDYEKQVQTNKDRKECMNERMNECMKECSSMVS